MELFGRNKNRRKGRERTRKEKNVTETYGSQQKLPEWWRNGKERRKN